MMMDGPQPLAEFDEFVKYTGREIAYRVKSPADVALLCYRISQAAFAAIRRIERLKEERGQ